jgi:hypothetical protein
MLGVTFDYPLATQWSFLGAVLGGGYRGSTASARREGWFTSHRATSTCRPLRYQLSACVDLDAGYAFHYYTQHESSHEDGNYIQLWDYDLLVAVHYRF